ETIERIQADPPSVVCVSSVAPTHFLQVRALCKKLLKADDSVPIVLGLWGEDLENADLDQRLPPSDRIHVFSKLRDAAERATSLASRAASAKSLRPTAV